MYFSFEGVEQKTRGNYPPELEECSSKESTRRLRSSVPSDKRVFVLVHILLILHMPEKRRPLPEGHVKKSLWHGLKGKKFPSADHTETIG